MGIDLKLATSIFIGGGSSRLKKYIKKSAFVGEAIFIDNINANVTGYEALAQKLI